MHDHSRHSEEGHSGEGRIRAAFILNISFTLLEIAGGLWTNSLAILSDALHDLGDSFSLGLAWYFEKLSGKGSTEKFTYGYQRFSLLGAFINSVILVTGSIFIIIEAIPRVFAPEEVQPRGMLLLAVIGITINGLAALRMRHGNKLSERVILLHLMEDVLGWIAVLLISIIMIFVDIPVLDPLLSIGIAAFVLWKVMGKLFQTSRIFLQSIPYNIDPEQIQRELRELPGVLDFHDFHAWSLDGEHNIATFHLVVKEETVLREYRSLKARCKEIMKANNVFHTTVEIETENEHD